MHWTNDEGLTVISNCQRRDLVDIRTVESTGAEMDSWWTDDDLFFKYWGGWYALSEFERIQDPDAFPGPLKWQGSMATSYFDGRLVKVVHADMEDYVIVGRFYQ